MQNDLNQLSDEHLLRAFTVAGAGSEAAFEALVRKYLGLVLGIAVRRTGDRALAEEIAQNVFLVLARKAKRLQPVSSLAGWLHRVTVIECAGAMRCESSQKAKMNAVSEHLLTDAAGRDVWREALPLLDEGIDALARGDREIIVLRFFERKSFREIGAALGKSDDAAQKQTERALGKLSGFLKKKGVVVPVGTLASGLAALTTPAAPAALAHSIAHGAISAASSFSAKLLILRTLKAMNYAQSKAAAVIASLLLVPIVVQQMQNHRLREALDQSRDKVQALVSGSATYSLASAAPRDFTSRQPEDSADAHSAATAHVAPEKVAQDWELVLFNPDPVQRALRLSQLLGSLRAEDAPAIAVGFEHAEKSGLKFPDEMRLFLRAWGRVGGAAPVEYAVKRWGNADSSELLASIAGWATSDPRAARTWLETVPAGDRDKLAYGLLDGWSLVDFPAAAAYAASQPGSPARDHFSELLSQRALRAGGITAAQDWVARIPDDDANLGYKQRSFDNVIQAMLLRDPASAAAWISQLHDQPFAGGDAVSHTAAKLAETSPAGALQWLGALDSESPVSAAHDAGEVLKSWAIRDVTAAGTWLGQNTDHPYYDAMAGSYVRTILRTDASAATAWANTIQDAGLRQQALAPQQILAIKSRYDLTMASNSIGSGSSVESMVENFEGFNYVIGTAAGSAPVAITYDSTLSGDILVEAESSSGPGPRNPHGSGVQWRNCTSCHSN